MIHRIENAMEWLLGTVESSRAVDFIIVALVVLTVLYLGAQVIRWLG